MLAAVPTSASLQKTARSRNLLQGVAPASSAGQGMSSSWSTCNATLAPSCAGMRGVYLLPCACLQLTLQLPLGPLMSLLLAFHLQPPMPQHRGRPSFCGCNRQCRRTRADRGSAPGAAESICSTGSVIMFLTSRAGVRCTHAVKAVPSWLMVPVKQRGKKEMWSVSLVMVGTVQSTHKLDPVCGLTRSNLDCVQKGALGLGEVELASCPTLHLPADAQMLCSTPMHGSYLAGTAHAPNSVTGPRMSSPACHTSLLSNSGPEAPCHSPHSTPDVRPLICHHIMSSRSQQKPLPPSTLTGVQGATPPRTLKRTHCTHCGTCLYDAWHIADEAETGPCTLKTLKLLASPCCWEPCSCCTRLWHLSPQKPAPPHP